MVLYRSSELIDTLWKQSLSLVKVGWVFRPEIRLRCACVCNHITLICAVWAAKRLNGGSPRSVMRAPSVAITKKNNTMPYPIREWFSSVWCTWFYETRSDLGSLCSESSEVDFDDLGDIILHGWSTALVITFSLLVGCLLTWHFVIILSGSNDLVFSTSRDLNTLIMGLLADSRKFVFSDSKNARGSRGGSTSPFVWNTLEHPAVNQLVYR